MTASTSQAAGPGIALRRLPGLRLFVAGRTISALGDSVHRIALALMIYAMTGSAVAVGLVLLTTAVPALLMAPFAGVLLDRTDRRRLIIWCELARVPVVASLAVAPSVEAVYVCAFVANMLGFVSSAGLGAVVPDLFDRGRLAAVNALTKSCTRLMHVIGPLVAGVIVVAGYPAAFLLDAATFLVSAATLMAMRGPRTGQSPLSTPPKMRLLSGWRELTALPLVRQVTVAMSAVMIVGGAFNVALVVHLRTTLQLPDHAYAVFMSVAGAGLLTGAALVVWCGRRLGMVRLLYVAILADGALIGVLGVLTPYPLVLTVGFAIGVVSGLANVASLTVLQLETPDAVRGRVFTTYEMCVQTLSVASMAAGGWAVAALGTRPILVAGGVVIVVLTSFVARSEIGSQPSNTREQT